MGMVPWKDGNYVAIGHGMPKTASNYQSQRKACNRFSLLASERHHALILEYSL